MTIGQKVDRRNWAVYTFPHEKISCSESGIQDILNGKFQWKIVLFYRRISFEIQDSSQTRETF